MKILRRFLLSILFITGISVVLFVVLWQWELIVCIILLLICYSVFKDVRKYW